MRVHHGTLFILFPAHFASYFRSTFCSAFLRSSFHSCPALEIHNAIIFNFYPGLPLMWKNITYLVVVSWLTVHVSITKKTICCYGNEYQAVINQLMCYITDAMFYVYTNMQIQTSSLRRPLRYQPALLISLIHPPLIHPPPILRPLILPPLLLQLTPILHSKTSVSWQHI